MNDAALVGRVEPLRDLPPDRDNFGDAERVMRDSFGERHALDEFEDEHLDSRRVFFETVNLGDVRVVERRERLCFAAETRSAAGILFQHGTKNLQRDVTVQFRVASAIDLAHASGAQWRDDLVGANACTGGQRQTNVDYT